MDRCSYFIDDKALFGSFPTQETVNILEEIGVRYFIDLTDDVENKTEPYITKYRYIKYPVEDRGIPEHWKSFAQLIVRICNIIDDLGPNEKIYIHCKGGHGRSGILVACVLCHYYAIPPDTAIIHTSKCHANRQVMREKWRKMGSPQGKRQRDFVHKFFRELRYTDETEEDYGEELRSPKSSHFNCTYGFSNFSPHPVSLPGLGMFPNAHYAFQAFQASNNPVNRKYIEKLLLGIYQPELIVEPNTEWENLQTNYMYKVLDRKFRQHTYLKCDLMATCLRPLVKISENDFWGNGNRSGNNITLGTGTPSNNITRESLSGSLTGSLTGGKNIHGKLLSQLRNNFLSECE